MLGLWLHRGLGPLREEKVLVVGLSLVVLGIQLIFGAFFLSVLSLGHRTKAAYEPQPYAPAATSRTRVRMRELFCKSLDMGDLQAGGPKCCWAVGTIATFRGRAPLQYCAAN